MTDKRYSVAPIVAAKARAAGPAGERWLRDLPETVALLEAAWDVQTKARLDGGTASFVVTAATAAGEDVVLKIAVPGVGLEREVWTLAAAQGSGYVKLLAHDSAHNAVLLERLGSSLDRSGLPPLDQISVIGALLQQAWRVEHAVDAPVFDQAAHLATIVLRFHEQLPEAVSDDVLDYALACARRRSSALDERQCVWLHGDAAPVNTLKVSRERAGAATGFVFVDPSSFIGDPAYDAGVALRDWCPQLLAAAHPYALLQTYADTLSSVTGIDPVAIWEWGFLERVSTGLYCLSLGDADRARPFLGTASTLVSAPDLGAPKRC